MPVRTLPAWPAGRPLRAWQEEAVAAAGWRDDEDRGDPWEAEPEAGGETGDDTAVGLDEPVVVAPPPSRGLLRRGRR